MKYFLKAKRYSILNFLYDHSYGSTERVLFFDNEKDILSYFKLALEEDLVKKTELLDKENTWDDGGHAIFQTVMQLSSTKISFAKLLKDKFDFLKQLHLNNESSANVKDSWRRFHKLQYLKCSPDNYKIFTIEQKDVRGNKLKVIQKLTWYQFYKKCLESGMTDDQIVFNAD